MIYNVVVPFVGLVEADSGQQAIDKVIKAVEDAVPALEVHLDAPRWLPNAFESEPVEDPVVLR